MKKEATHRPVIVAAIVASAVMLTLGVGYRAAAAWLAAPVVAEPISQDRLNQLPLQIGEWVGEDMPIDPNIVSQADVDAYVSRRYSRRNGSESISLWIASGVQTRDLMPHRPEVCYIGNGYTLMDQRSPELPLDAEAKLPCNVMQFSKGGLNSERVMVLYYYLVDGIHCQDVGQWRYRIFDRIGYVAQVQIVVSVTTPPGADVVQRKISDFATESAVPIAQLFEGFGQSQSED